MSGILQDLSPASLVTANEANQFELYALFGRWQRAEVHDGANLLWGITDVPFPMFNFILRAELEPSQVNATIDAAIARGKAQHVPLMWITSPSTRPTDLGACLEAHGFTRGGTPTGMAIDLLTLDQNAPMPDGLTVERVEQDHLALSEVCVHGFEMPEFVVEPMRQLFDCLGAEKCIRYYLGKLDSAPAACSLLYLGAGVAGIYNVATLPHARGRGIGAAITLAALRDARDLGYRVGILQASKMGLPVYRRLGFQENFKYVQYIWKKM